MHLSKAAMQQLVGENGGSVVDDISKADLLVANPASVDRKEQKVMMAFQKEIPVVCEMYIDRLCSDLTGFYQADYELPVDGIRRLSPFADERVPRSTSLSAPRRKLQPQRQLGKYQVDPDAKCPASARVYESPKGDLYHVTLMMVFFLSEYRPMLLADGTSSIYCSSST